MNTFYHKWIKMQIIVSENRQLKPADTPKRDYIELPNKRIML